MTTLLRFFAGILCTLFFIGCSTAQKEPPAKAPQSARKELEKIQIEIAAGANRKALYHLQNFIKKHPGTDASDDARMLMGRIYYKQKDYQSAYQSFMSLVDSNTLSRNETDALLWASWSLVKLGRNDEAASLTNRLLKIPGLSAATKLEIYRLRFSTQSAMNDQIDALKSLVYLAENETEASVRESQRIKALEYTESRMSESELAQVAESAEFGFLRGYALFRLANIYFEQRDFNRARNAFRDVMDLLPNSDLSEKASAKIKQIDARRQVNPQTIGAIIPLSGKHAAIGSRILRGLQLGLGIYGPERSDLRLAVIDEDGNPDSARRGVERLVTEDHVIGIVGSLLSRTATAVASKADELGVPSIGLSQKMGLTDIGKTVFRNALTSEMQVRELVRTAMDQFGIRNFAILYPNDSYGTEYANLFWDEVLARGGTITGAQSYNSDETDFSGPVQRLIGTFYVEDRVDEYKSRLKEWQKKAKSPRSTPPDDLLPPLVDFEAIFIPDNVKAVGQIAPMLSFNDVNNITLLGTNLWNTEDLIRRGQKSVESAVFVDSALPRPDDFRRLNFYHLFRQTFNEEPTLFEIQGYDAGLMIRQALASGERTRVGLSERLTSLRQFSGALGPMAVSPQRELLRPISTLGVQHGQIVPLAQANLTPRYKKKVR